MKRDQKLSTLFLILLIRPFKIDVLIHWMGHVFVVINATLQFRTKLCQSGQYFVVYPVCSIVVRRFIQMGADYEKSQQLCACGKVLSLLTAVMFIAY